MPTKEAEDRQRELEGHINDLRRKPLSKLSVNELYELADFHRGVAESSYQFYDVRDIETHSIHATLANTYMLEIVKRCNCG